MASLQLSTNPTPAVAESPIAFFIHPALRRARRRVLRHRTRGDCGARTSSHLQSVGNLHRGYRGSGAWCRDPCPDRAVQASVGGVSCMAAIEDTAGDPAPDASDRGRPHPLVSISRQWQLSGRALL